MPQDYNNTINLPKTDFPMRAGLPKREPVFLADWEQGENRLYHDLMKKNEGKPLFILHDGPPYANGNLHMGHALNKVLKDFIIRYKNMAGFCAPYVPGWDTHGLPIERQAIKAYGMDRDKVSVSEFRHKCEEFARQHVDTQREQFKRLGIVADWEHPYLTLTHDFEAKQIEIFGEMAKKGYIYKGLKPVYWCPHDETALAEAEIEYQDEKCSSIYVKFAVTDDKGVISKRIGTTENVYFVIWTTTTWTLPGNLAISVNPFFEYDLVKVPNGDIYVLAKELTKSVMDAAGIDSWEVLGTLLGSDLEMMKTKHPLMDRESVVICGEHVTLDAGTGCVHTAPGFGAEDFVVCQQYKIPIIVPVDGKGYATKDAGKYAGMYYEKTTPVILEDLKAGNALLAIEEIQHSYPHCWRCKNPIIFRATEQWFCSVDALKGDAVKACHDITWLPGWGEDRMTSMIQERSDWCISRQRIWGVPIPIFICKKCGKPLVTEQTIKIVSNLFREKGSNAWFEMDASEILPTEIRCECGCNEFDKETDTMDVWFDSGSSWAAVIGQREGQPIPVDVYLEGNDQYRGWFQSSMLTAIATKGIAPYKTVITHGMIVDEERQKMSKSAGNGISPQDLIKDYGADILRLWVASADYRQDMRISKEMFKHLSQNYLKIRNTARYILGNLQNFNPSNLVSYEELPALDRWALMKLNDLIVRVRKGYDSYEFHTVMHAIHNFCVVDMSNFYLDVIKDRLYCDEVNGISRRSAQTTIYFILDALVRMIAPILCFTSDEIWKAMPHKQGDDLGNIVLNDMPDACREFDLSEDERVKWERLIALRDEVNKALEAARNAKAIGKPLEASVTIRANSVVADFLEGCNMSLEELASLCIVSKLKLVRDDTLGEADESFNGFAVDIERASGEKCERCWIYSDSIGAAPKHPTLCSRCAAVVG